MRAALLGCGDVAQRDYLPELHRLGDRVDLVAVCGRTEARVRQVANQYGVSGWYTDYARMLVEADVDAVINLTPIQIHAETTLMALHAGKHVYTEKPVATSVAEAEEIRSLARDRGLVIVAAPSILLFPQVREIQKLLQEDAIGPVHSMIGQGFGGVPPWKGYMSDPSTFFAEGAGPVVDMGVYPLHVVTGLFGPACRVSAMAVQAQESFIVEEGPAAGTRTIIEVEDTWHLMLELEGDRIATILANNSSTGSRAPQLEIYGLRGTIAVSLLDVSAPIHMSDPGGNWTEINVPHQRRSGPDHLLGVEHLVECVQHGRIPVLSIDHALHVLSIIEAAKASASGGQHVEIGSVI